jgi:hypothetical protein
LWPGSANSRNRSHAIPNEIGPCRPLPGTTFGAAPAWYPTAQLWFEACMKFEVETSVRASV